MRRIAVVLVVPMVALAGAGCSEQIDTAKAERSIKTGIESKTSGGVPVRSVSCPKDVEVKKGKSFDCTVTGTNGKKATITVVQTDDKGNVTYSGNLAALVER
jgi:Domain of unknown function (DUF4333)